MANIYKDNWNSYRQIGLTPLLANGKVPAVKWGEEDLNNLVSDHFANWAENYPDANIWVLLGDEFMVIDPTGWG
jgi:hypothetical protein